MKGGDHFRGAGRAASLLDALVRSSPRSAMSASSACVGSVSRVRDDDSALGGRRPAQDRSP